MIIKKCSPNGICVGLNRVLDDSRIRSQIIYDFAKGCEPVKWMITLHAGDHKKDGIVANFCPFCGQKLGVMKYTKEKKRRNAAFIKKAMEKKIA